MTSQPDFVVVDDTSTTQPEQIRYSAGWVALPRMDGVLGTGPPLYRTLHVALSPANFTFTYNGAVGPLFVMGSILSETIPAWSCMLDNEPMDSIQNTTSSIPFVSNHVQLCWLNSRTTPVGEHTILVSVITSDGNPAFFDYIMYTPAPEVRPGDLFFNSTNPGMHYTGPGWQMDGNTGMATSNPGDTLDFVFNGHTVSWVGFFNAVQGKTPASATYSIDGSSPVNFTFENTANLGASNPALLTDQVFFQTAPQVPGLHHLQVTYHGAIGSTPLALDHLIIQNSTADFALTPSPAVTGSGDTSQSPFISSLRRGSSSTNILTTTSTSSILSSTHTANRPTLSSPLSTNSVSPTNMSSRARASPIAKAVGISMGVLAFLCIAIFSGYRVGRARSRASSRIAAQSPRPFTDGDHHAPTVPEKERQRPSLGTFPDAERQSPAPESSARAGKARRLAEVAAATLRRYRPRSRSWRSSSQPISEGPTSRIVMHQDSGIPLRQPDEEEVLVIDIEVPPAYATIR